MDLDTWGWLVARLQVVGWQVVSATIIQITFVDWNIDKIGTKFRFMFDKECRTAQIG